MSNRSWRSILFYDPCGPMLHYAAGVLTVSDLNPQIETKWTVSRAELFRIGWRCIVAAIGGRR